jgi:hypothetical protein
MNREDEIKSLELASADIKAKITLQEAILQVLWLELLEVQAKLAVARRDHDYDPE